MDDFTEEEPGTPLPDDEAREPEAPPRDEEPGPLEPEPETPSQDYEPRVGESAVVITVDRDEQHAAAHRASWASTNWPWVLGLGIVGIVFGLVLLSHAFGTLRSLVWLVGLFLLFMGVVQLVTIGRGGSRGAHFLGAAISIAGGIILLVWPGETLKVAAWVAGLTFLVWGIVRVVTGLRERREGRTWDLWSGVALAVLGIVVMAWPSATITLIGVLIGLVAIAWGVMTVIAALDLRRVGRQWEAQHRRPHGSA